MSKVSLRAYNREIEGLIEEGHRLDEAVAHCHHILKTYPKHLDTYRLLGKAYLELKRYDPAVDIFRRVLVAAPEDFISHVGMSIIADDQGKLDDAIWHMERAFEVQPSNAAIQAELQRLFGRRDGVEPPKIRLTRGALAHMYVQGELYTQAVSECRAVLAHDKNRTDMQVLLARAYFRNGQRAEATEVCTALLAISPYCFEANRLMAEVPPGAQATDATREYLRRVVELDPYVEFAQGSVYNTEAVADGAVTLQRLDYAGIGAEAGPPLAISLEPGGGVAESVAPPPSWLTSKVETDARAQPAVSDGRDLPEFMRKTGWRAIDTGTPEETAALDSGIDLEAQAVPGDLPEWVKALAPGEESQGATPRAPDWVNSNEESASAASASADDLGAEDETPAWLRDLAMGSEQTTQAPAGTGRVQESEEPDSVVDVSRLERSDQKPDDALAWLEGLTEKHETKPGEFPTSPNARPGETPEWIEDADQVGEPYPKGWRPIPETETGPAADAREALEPSPPVPDRRPFDWLSGLSDQNTFTEMEEPPEGDQAPFIDEQGAPALPRPARTRAIGEVPDWLESDRVVPNDTPSPGSRETLDEDESAVELPEWLADLGGEQAMPHGVAPQDTSSEASAVPLEPQDASRPASAASSQREWFSDESTGTGAVPAAPRGEPQSEYGLQIPEALPARTQPAPSLLRISIPSLSGAKAELGRGNIAAALDQYGRLIRKGRSLEEIIRDLRDALYRYPVEVPIWQALGDAYMRANRLQEALDAYTKAEELLR